MKIQKGKRVRLPEEDASEIWDITFSITNNEVAPLSVGGFLVSFFLPFDLMYTKSQGKLEQVFAFVWFVSTSNIWIFLFLFGSKNDIYREMLNGILSFFRQMDETTLCCFNSFDVQREEMIWSFCEFIGSRLNGSGRWMCSCRHCQWFNDQSCYFCSRWVCQCVWAEELVLN